MYNKTAMEECEELFKHLQYKDFAELRYNIPKQTLQAPIKKALVLDYAKEILQIAEKSLKTYSTGEEIFLDPIKEYTLNGLCPADILIKNWNGCWNRNMKKLINYLSEK